MGKSHLGNVKIDKVMLGNTEVSAIYLGSEKVYPNTVLYEKWSLKWDTSSMRNEFMSNRPTAHQVDILTMEVSSVRTNVIDTIGVHYSDYPPTSNSTTVRIIDSLGLPYGHYPLNISLDILSTCRVQDALIETVEAVDGTYPDDGVQDGFYYIKI